MSHDSASGTTDSVALVALCSALTRQQGEQEVCFTLDLYIIQRPE